MAFNRDNLTIITNNVKAGVVPAVWVYYNEANDLVTATDFLTEGRMTVGDLVIVMYGQLAGEYYRVSAKSTDLQSVTITKLAAQLLQAAGIETITATDLYHNVSVATPLSLVVTSAANLTDTFTTSATADNFVTFGTDSIVDGINIRVSSATTLPTGLVAATDYYAVNSSGNKCRLSLTRGGAPVDITSAGTGVHTATAQGNQLYLADGFEGQRKIIKVKTDGGENAVVYPPNFSDGTIITAGDINDSFELIFENSEWHVISLNGVAVS